MRSPKPQLVPLATLTVALALAVPAALADGDPASDYLISQPTYLSPFDGKVSAEQANILAKLLADAKAKGFTLRVAVIVTPYDLGSVPFLFDKPQRYANFLGQEDYYFFKDELLVVMPNGYGLYKARALPAADKAVIAALPPPNTKDGNALVMAADRAVIALAAKRGIALHSASGSGSAGSSTSRDRALIAAAVLLAGLLALGVRYGRRLWRSAQ